MSFELANAERRLSEGRGTCSFKQLSVSDHARFIIKHNDEHHQHQQEQCCHNDKEQKRAPGPTCDTVMSAVRLPQDDEDKSEVSIVDYSFYKCRKETAGLPGNARPGKNCSKRIAANNKFFLKLSSLTIFG